MGNKVKMSSQSEVRQITFQYQFSALLLLLGNAHSVSKWAQRRRESGNVPHLPFLAELLVMVVCVAEGRKGVRADYSVGKTTTKRRICECSGECGGSPDKERQHPYHLLVTHASRRACVRACNSTKFVSNAMLGDWVWVTVTSASGSRRTLFILHSYLK